MENKEEVLQQNIDKPKKEKSGTKFFVFVCSLTLACSVAVTYAWVSLNNTVRSGNVEFGVSSSVLDAFTDDMGNNMKIVSDEQYSLSKLSNTVFLPGTGVDFEIGLMNLTDNEIQIKDFGIEAPSVALSPDATGSYDDIPIYGSDGKTLLYFAKSLKISLVSYRVYEDSTYTSNVVSLNSNYTEYTKTGTIVHKVDGDVITDTPVSGDDGSAFVKKLDGEKILMTDDMVENPTSIRLASGLDVSVGSKDVVIFRLHIEFVNEESTDQSEFQGFGGTEKGGKCQRHVYITFNEMSFS